MLKWPSVFVALLIALFCAAPSAWSEDYPTRPITMIVPFPPGGGADAIARLVAEKLSSAMGQQIIVDNRGGAAGVLGMRAGAKAAPDGYTLIMSTTGNTSINPSLYANPGYDPRKDFAPIGLVASTPIVLMVNASSPVKSIGDLIAFAKRQPGKLTIGTPPPGTENYMAAELFKAMTGADMTIVTYKGTGPLTNDLLGGQITVAFNTTLPALGNLRAGNLRALVVAGSVRSNELPEVPAAAEAGLPGFEAAVRYGLLAPAGTPQPIIERINRELRRIENSSGARKNFADRGGDPLISTPEEYAADIDREEMKWSALIKKLGLHAE